MASNPVSPASESTWDNESTAQYESNASYNASKFKCKECSRKFSTRFNLQRHMKSIHEEESSEESDKDSDDESDFVCEECNRDFATQSSLRRHMKSFHEESSEATDASSEATDDESDFVCEECNRDFATQSSLRRHLKSFHEESSEATDASSEASDASNEESHEPVRKRRRFDEGKYATSLFISTFQQVLDEFEDGMLPLKEEMNEEDLSDGMTLKCALLNSDEAKKRLLELFTENTFLVYEHVAHPLIKTIREKMYECIRDGLDAYDAMKYAVKCHKHAIYNLIKYIPMTSCSQDSNQS